MGGINHQPCKHYLRESTALSRCVSLARSQFEQANIALEDILLLELDKKQGSINPIRHHLQLSQDYLHSALVCLVALKTKMHDLNYQDLPPLHTIDTDQLGQHLATQGIVDDCSWNKMARLMKNSTFFANIKEFELQVHLLLKNTSMLLVSVDQLGDFADDGTMHNILEENRQGNIKIFFAKLYTAWNLFQADFLASSILSTEVWYAHNEYGSLTGLKIKEVV